MNLLKDPIWDKNKKMLPSWEIVSNLSPVDKLKVYEGLDVVKYNDTIMERAAILRSKGQQVNIIRMGKGETGQLRLNVNKGQLELRIEDGAIDGKCFALIIKVTPKTDCHD